MKKLTAHATWPRKSLNGNVNVAAKAIEEEVNKVFKKLDINFKVECTDKTDGEIGIQFDFIEVEKKAAPVAKPKAVEKPAAREGFVKKTPSKWKKSK
jgi:hypothetical protein